MSVSPTIQGSQKRNRRDKLIYENKIYTLSRDTGSAKYYRCAKRFCYGKCTKTGDLVSVSGEHICLISSLECNIEMARKRMREFSEENPFVPPARVITEVQQEFSNSTLQGLPTNSTLGRSIRMWRRPKGVKEPTQRSEIVLTAGQMMTSDGKRFLYHDSNDDKRILVFASDRCIEELSMCNIWAIDGTFDVVSNLYVQLLTIHGITRSGWIYPLVYALLPDKKTITYKYLYDQLNLNSKGCILRPEILLLDFEEANMNALSDCYEGVVLQGCHFHFVQALYRNFTTNMKNLYLSDDEFSLFMRRFFSLPFVKIQDIHMAFVEIRGLCSYKDELKKELDTFFAYVKRTYIGSVYDPPMYPHHFWNVHERVQHNIPRTNNAVESWHRRLTILAEGSHRPIYQLIKLFHLEEKHVSVSIEKRIAGEAPTIKKNKQVMLDSRLSKLVNEYGESELGDFLKGVAYNMTYMRKYRYGNGKERFVQARDDDDDEVEEGELDEIDELEATQLVVANEPEPKRQRLEPNRNFDKTYSSAPIRRPRRNRVVQSKINFVPKTK